MKTSRKLVSVALALACMAAAAPASAAIGNQAQGREVCVRVWQTDLCVTLPWLAAE